MYEFTIGDKIADNDHRMIGRVLTITEVGAVSVVAINSNRSRFSILKRRIYTDGKPRKSGFRLVRTDQPALEAQQPDQPKEN